MKDIAIILTVHNRKFKTQNCLNSIYKNNANNTLYNIDVYITDDASTDGTKEMIKKEFPDAILINGNGNLFWCKGMYLAWKQAIDSKEYDYYLWLNDDVILFENSIRDAIEDSELFEDKNIIYGAMQGSNGELTYGGFSKNEDLIGPNNKLQKIFKFCGNFLLIPKYVVDKIGIIENIYSHAFGDFDYAMRAYKNNIDAYLMPQFVGICEKHDNIDKFRDKKYSIIQRFKFLYSPLYTPIDHFIFNRRHFSIFRAFRIFIQLNILTIFPNIKKQKL